MGVQNVSPLDAGPHGSEVRSRGWSGDPHASGLGQSLYVDHASQCDGPSHCPQELSFSQGDVANGEKGQRSSTTWPQCSEGAVRVWAVEGPSEKAPSKQTLPPGEPAPQSAGQGQARQEGPRVRKPAL